MWRERAPQPSKEASLRKRPPPHFTPSLSYNINFDLIYYRTSVYKFITLTIMKKRSVRYLRAASKSDNGMKKMGRSKPRKGPDELVEMPVEKVTSMRSMTKVDSRSKGKAMDLEDDEDFEEELLGEMEEGEDKKVGVIGK